MTEPETRSPAGSIDPETLAAYSRLADRYVEDIAFSRAEADEDIRTFLRFLPEGPQPVLDWGAGAGETAAIFADRGVAVEATDASPEMAAIAAGLGVRVRIEPFEALAPAPPRFRGVWATASLSHAPRDMVPDLIARAAGTLVPRGLLHLNMKAGEPGLTEGRDAFGRYFCYWEVDELSRLVEGLGLKIIYATEWIGPSLDRGTERYAIVLAGRR